MAPEVIKGEYDSSADIWGVGCTVLPPPSLSDNLSDTIASFSDTLADTLTSHGPASPHTLHDLPHQHPHSHLPRWGCASAEARNVCECRKEKQVWARVKRESERVRESVSSESAEVNSRRAPARSHFTCLCIAPWGGTSCQDRGEAGI